MSFLSRLGIAPQPEAHYVRAGWFARQDLGPYYDQGEAQRVARETRGKVRPLTLPMDDDEQEEPGPFGGRQQTLAGNVWASGFGGGRGPWG